MTATLYWSLYPHYLQRGDTALLIASENGHLEVIHLLLNAGAAVFIPNKVWRVVKLLFFGDFSNTACCICTDWQNSTVVGFNQWSQSSSGATTREWC